VLEHISTLSPVLIWSRDVSVSRDSNKSFRDTEAVAVHLRLEDLKAVNRLNNEI